jgi:hypothetical protein
MQEKSFSIQQWQTHPDRPHRLRRPRQPTPHHFLQMPGLTALEICLGRRPRRPWNQTSSGGRDVKSDRP